MCLLYRLDSAARDIAQIFDADPGSDPWDGNYVAPGKFAPVVVEGKAGRYLTPRLWGVPPPPRGDRPIYNVRNLDSPFWIGTLRHSEFRCLVPVTAFMEWGAAPAPDGSSGTRRRQHWFGVPSEPVFAFAGIWRDSEIASFAFLTCEPNPLVGAVHGKSMPVIVAPWDYERWLTADWADARNIVGPFGSQMMAEIPAPTRV